MGPKQTKKRALQAYDSRFQKEIEMVKNKFKDEIEISEIKESADLDNIIKFSSGNQVKICQIY